MKEGIHQEGKLNNNFNRTLLILKLIEIKEL